MAGSEAVSAVTAMRLYPQGTGAGIALVVLVVIGVVGVAQFDAAKRASFEEGFRCASDESTPVVHSSYNCKGYREQREATNQPQRAQ